MFFYVCYDICFFMFATIYGFLCLLRYMFFLCLLRYLVFYVCYDVCFFMFATIYGFLCLLRYMFFYVCYDIWVVIFATIYGFLMTANNVAITNTCERKLRYKYKCKDGDSIKN